MTSQPFAWSPVSRMFASGTRLDGVSPRWLRLIKCSVVYKIITKYNGDGQTWVQMVRFISSEFEGEKCTAYTENLLSVRGLGNRLNRLIMTHSA